MVSITTFLRDVSVIVGNEGQSQYCEWPSLARITQPFYIVNSLPITHFRCATEIDEKGNYINGEYKNCDVRTISGPQFMKTCIFPFNYNGTTFTDCTTAGHDQLWCPTKVDDEQNTIEEQWGNCIYSGSARV